MTENKKMNIENMIRRPAIAVAIIASAIKTLLYTILRPNIAFQPKYQKKKPVSSPVPSSTHKTRMGILA